MRRFLQATVAAAVVAILVSPAAAARIAFRPAAQRAINADVVVVGKVTGFEKELVQAAQTPGAKDTVGYKIALVKIESALVGASKMTEIKVGFIPPPQVDPNAKPPAGGPIRRPIGGLRAPDLKEGQELILFLVKHPSGNFYAMPGMAPPVDAATEQGKQELEAVKKVTTLLADPMKGLKSDKPEVRTETATALILKYRATPAFAEETEEVAIPADESKIILQALTANEWSNRVAGLNPAQAFYALGLTDKDGWVPPAIAPSAPGAPAVDFNAIQRDAFTQWLNGPGKSYQIKKIVTKVQK